MSVSKNLDDAAEAMARPCNRCACPNFSNPGAIWCTTELPGGGSCLHAFADHRVTESEIAEYEEGMKMVKTRELTRREFAEEVLADDGPDYWRAVCWTEGFKTLLTGNQNDCWNAALAHAKATGHQTSNDHVT